MRTPAAARPDGADRARADRPHAQPGGGALAIGLIFGVLFIAAGAGRLYLEAAPLACRGLKAAHRRPARPAQAARQPGAVRDRPGLHRRLDLLLHRPRGRARARADLAGVPGRRAAVRRRRALLRRGRVAAPGARRRDGDRPLRVQRAGQLHRRLGDLPGLPDPRRAVRVRHHGLPGRVLARLRLRLPGVRRGRAGRALRRARGHPRRRRRGATSAPRCSCWATSCCSWWSSRSGSRCCSSPTCSLHPAAVAGAPAFDDLVFAFPLVLVAFSGIDASSGLAGQVAIGRKGLRRLIGVRLLAAVVPVPRHRARRLLGAAGHRQAVRRGAGARHRRRVRPGLAARAAALPGGHLGRRDPRSAPPRRPCSGSRGSATRWPSTARSRRGSATCTRARATPVVIIGFGAVVAIGLLIPADLEFLAAICAFGATLAFTIVGALGLPAALQRARPRPAVPDAAQRALHAAARCRSRRSCAC